MNAPDGPAAAHQADESAILLVEDDHGDAVLVQACLSEAGVSPSRVRWVRTLADALDALVTLTPGCVLVDLGLPDASGYEVVRRLVDAVPDVAVIVLTGRQDHDGAGALGAGAQDYLVKDSITAELLERSIRYSVERTRAQQAQQQLFEARLNAAEQARLERGLLPSPVLHSAAVGCATYYRPGRDDAVLGGDFFDVLETPDGRVHAVIGDVMGHGADEAALGVHLRVAWRTLLLAGVEDEAILPNLDAVLAADQSTGSRFVTVCGIVLEPGRALVRLAGHPAPVVVDGAGATYPRMTVGPPLGVATTGPGGGDRWPTSRRPVRSPPSGGKEAGTTAHVEWLWRTVRQRCTRLARTPLSFSRCPWNYLGALRYVVRLYNASRAQGRGPQCVAVMPQSMPTPGASRAIRRRRWTR